MSKGRPENRRPVDQETKKDNKNIIQKMVFPCPYRLLDTTFSILILSWRDLHHNLQNRANFHAGYRYYVL